MKSVDVLSNKVNQHFRHPIPSVMYGTYDILTVGQMIKLEDSELKRIRNFGVASMNKVNEFRNLVSRANFLLENVTFENSSRSNS